jgi:hypothetical protein
MYASAASAAGVSVLALAGASEAKVVYTETHQSMQPRLPLYIDLNHDGIRDFALRTIYYLGSYFEMALNASSAYHGVKNAIAGKRAGNGYFFSAASALRPGASIGPKLQFPVHRPVLAEEEFAAHAHSTQFSDLGPWVGKGEGLSDRYLGLKFFVDGKPHYGWARLSLTIAHHREYDDVNATLTGYAYETTPNQAILAGDTGTPNATQSGATSSTLGSLALGQK